MECHGCCDENVDDRWGIKSRAELTNSVILELRNLTTCKQLESKPDYLEKLEKLGHKIIQSWS